MEKEKFEVILQAVIFDPKNKKILLGRREKDPNIPQLTWCFPGGRAKKGKDVDKVLKEKIKEKTGHEIKNLGSIFAKSYPEKEDLLAIYFLCESVGGNDIAGGDLVELKWVDPEEIENHFTTSFHTRLKEYILNLK